MPRITRSQDEENSTMVIGIDFGTTYSGVAFAHTSRPKHIQVVSNWTDGRNTNKGKCPTLLTYCGGQVASWGYGAAQDCRAIKWFKLLLLEQADVPLDLRVSDELQEADKKMRDLNKRPVELVADFLKQLWALTCEKMVKSASRDLVDNSRFHVVLSVPAIWPDYAKELMLEAARWAGICNDRPTRPASDTILDLIPEPEAAALATIMDNFDDKITLDGAAIAKAGDCFVVCDAGGGTADLITYKIQSINPWLIEECVRGDGKLCGAVMLDKGFRTSLQSKLDPERWKSISDSPHVFEVQWEKVIKREYKASTREQTVQLPFTGYPARNIYWKPVVTLTQDDLRGIFNPVTNSIIDLVRKQISSIPVRSNFRGPPAKYVVLVGGLGSSHHLYERLQDGVSAGPRGAEIIQSEGDLPWTAICRGAVLHGFNQQNAHGRAARGAPSFGVQSRIARRSYGTICTYEEWNPKEHSMADRRYCPVEDCWVADYQMSWFVRAGEPIREGEIKLGSFDLTLETAEDLEDGIKTELVYSDSPRPPRRCDETVKKHCEIHWDRVPSFASLPERLTDLGREVRDIRYGVEMIFKGASAYFGI